MDFSTKIDRSRLPRHIAIIMDGNGRWAKERGQDRVYGHHEGVLSVRAIVDASAEIGVEYLTLYAFSTENWNRPKEEVDALMELLVNTIRKEADDLHKNGVRLHVIGDFESLPAICQAELNEAMEMTADNIRLNLILALSYSARREMANAAKRIAIAVAQGRLDADDVDEQIFSNCLTTSAFPDPELMIRTSGEHRISNFLLYQLAYAELYFTPVHWPAFRKPHLLEAIYDYQQRERRFGLTSEQLQCGTHTTSQDQPGMHRLLMRFFTVLIVCLPVTAALKAQIAVPGGGGSKSGLGGGIGSGVEAEASKPKEYEIGGVDVTGANFLDKDLLLAVAGLQAGNKVRLPNDDAISRAIRQLWKQDLFADVRIDITRFVGDKVFLNIVVEERPKMSRYNFRGVKKGEATELKEKIGLMTNRVFTEAVRKEATVRIRKFFVDKGYGTVKVDVRERKDTNKVNSVIVTFNIEKGQKTHINQINISGNEAASAARLKRTFRGTKEMSRLTFHPDEDRSVYSNTDRSFGKYMKNFGFLSPTKTLDVLDPYFRFKLFSGSKYNEQKYEDDKQSLIAYYNSLGYRDASVAADTVYTVKNGNLNIDLKVKEGNRYYFGDVAWKGNTKYSNDQLSKILGIRKGDVYNAELLDRRIGRQLSPEGGEDISSLYMDDGYLFFNIDPVETAIVGDTINYEMRVTEGSQATIGQINIFGNDRTNEHVIRRELYTLPGNKFSRTDLIRSQRQIANLGFFDQEKIGIQPKPHPETGTVDIDYTVAEKSSDQLQLSAGFGGGVKFYGNIGIAFSNFSIRNILKPKYWDPLPVGDGQKFSINYQSNGPLYNSFNTSFTEPWLGGKKPNALTVSFVYSRFSGASSVADANTSYLRQAGGGVSLSRRLKWPDDNFVLTYGVNYQNYFLKNYTLADTFKNGYSNNLYFRFVLARYTVDQPLYPRNGSNISLTFQLTPPFSAFGNRNIAGETDADKYKLIEYHKYRFTADWYHPIVGNLVFKFSTKYGFLGYYNKAIGFSPFERFQLGGDGLSGQSYFIGRDIISQRGYEVYQQNATIFNKYTAEVRYPFSLSPTSTIYGLAFVDAANAWSSFKTYNPFKLNRDAGLGVRIFLPMFGLLGLDYGVGFDRYDKANGITSFKDISKFTFMLGFEPD